VNDEQKKLIETTAQGILDARALYPENSLADMYEENMHIFEQFKKKAVIRLDRTERSSSSKRITAFFLVT